VTFTPTASSPNGAVTSYQWDFGDGVVMSIATGNAVTHTYSTAGTYTVKLTVKDSTNATFVGTRVVIVGTADGLGVPYLDETGTPKVATSVTTLTGGGATTLNSGWYVCPANTTVTYSPYYARIKVNGNVHLILADNCNLKAGGGIDVSGANSITIYAQSTGNSMGSLTAEGIGGYTINDPQIAGIGGNMDVNNGIISIHGGAITVTGYGHCAGIGGCNSSIDGGKITITGGIIKATGGYYDWFANYQTGPGIGNFNGDITISGGEVTATGAYRNAGIGVGTATKITISGGHITSTGSAGGAGIGAGADGSTINSSIIITGNANVAAIGGDGVEHVDCNMYYCSYYDYGGGAGIGSGGSSGNMPMSVGMIQIASTAIVNAAGGSHAVNIYSIIVSGAGAKIGQGGYKGDGNNGAEIVPLP